MDPRLGAPAPTFSFVVVDSTGTAGLVASDSTVTTRSSSRFASLANKLASAPPPVGFFAGADLAKRFFGNALVDGFVAGRVRVGSTARTTLVGSNPKFEAPVAPPVDSPGAGAGAGAADAPAANAAGTHDVLAPPPASPFACVAPVVGVHASPNSTRLAAASPAARDASERPASPSVRSDPAFSFSIRSIISATASSSR